MWTYFHGYTANGVVKWNGLYDVFLANALTDKDPSVDHIIEVGVLLKEYLSNVLTNVAIIATVEEKGNTPPKFIY